MSQLNALGICLALIALATIACLGRGIGPLLISWRLKKNGDYELEIHKYRREGHIWVAVTGILVVAGVTIWLRDQYGNGWLALILAILPLAYYMLYWRKRRLEV